MKPLVQAVQLKKTYQAAQGFLGRKTVPLTALAGVDLAVFPGETLGVVGESGCGKSTLARLLMRLEEPTAGRVFFEGREITGLGPGPIRELRREMQLIFQDPYASLNPRLRVGRIIEEPFRIHGLNPPEGRRRIVEDLLGTVGLSPEAYDRYPHEFSGGQRQRIGIARALALRPKFIVADEPVSALDVSIQAQIINLLLDLQEQFALTYLFISHDLQVVSHVSDRIAVMYLGRILELGSREDFLGLPGHPYTEILRKASLGFDQAVVDAGLPRTPEWTSQVPPPSGCSFYPRCPYREDFCASEAPPLREIRPGYRVACHFR